MWVRSPGQEDSSEEGIATDFSYLAWEIPWTRGAWWATVHGIAKELDTTENTCTLQSILFHSCQRNLSK